MSVFFIPWAILPAEIFIYGECISVLVWRYLAEVNTGKKKQQKNRNKNLCKQQEHKYFWKRCCKWNSVANKASPKLEFLQAENSEGKFLFHSVLFPYSNITVIIFFFNWWNNLFRDSDGKTSFYFEGLVRQACSVFYMWSLFLAGENYLHLGLIIVNNHRCNGVLGRAQSHFFTGSTLWCILGELLSNWAYVCKLEF